MDLSHGVHQTTMVYLPKTTKKLKKIIKVNYGKDINN
ncbi:hypothetical protein DespoDRAFT_02575 [Desulfobacter postgatei 2ac9]|uniref:Uncharacterized protein n=1 Tax=Desulfobacter postgatei 2ac9 TaxID=879212 RepID=I5B4K7_9BACT|nr:hypothetical protein DespoDRAFT_02575 [Desulfobacter postgatei 2ac9]